MLNVYRLMSYALLSFLVLMAVVLVLVLPSEDLLAAPPVWLPAAQVLVGAALWFVIDLVGYRTPPLPVGTPREQAMEVARTRFATLFFLRFALSEPLALVSLALAFVLTPASLLVYLPGGLVSAVLIAVHVVPGRRPVEKLRAALESAGGVSYLDEALAAPPPGATRPR